MNHSPGRGGSRELLLVGGGHTHLQLLYWFAKRPPPRVRLTVVLDGPVSVYSGMVPGFIAAQYVARDFEIDVVALARRAGARVELSPAVRVDTAKRRIELHTGAEVPYDVAAFDVGSSTRSRQVAGVDAHALVVRPMLQFVHNVAGVVSRARDSRAFRVVVGGGGAGGMEIAFALRQRLRAHPNLSVTVVEAGAGLLTPGAPRLGRRVLERAQQRGIHVLLDRRIVAVTAESVRVGDGCELRCDALFWVTGAAGVPVFAASKLPVDDGGFVRTRATLQVEGYDDLFAVGDCATLIDHPETPKAGVYAVRQAPALAHNLLAYLEGRRLRRYVPQAEFLIMLNLGDGTAIASKRGLVFEGRWVMWLKDQIDRGFVNKFHSAEDG